MKNRRKRISVSGIIFLLGIGTLGLQLYHLISEENIYQILTGVVPPIIISIGLIFAAVWIYRSPLATQHLVRLLGWVVGGAVALVALGSAFMLYQISHGAEMSDAVFMIGNWAATGGLGGTFVGYYETKLLETQSELVEERDLVAEERASLERQNQRLEKLSYVVSHDIRNPLNVAKGRMELARETGDVSELDPALDALDRMNEIIEDTLDMARSGQPVDEDERETVSLEEMAEESWRGVETKDASLDVVGNLDFEADPSRLRNVFENLFRNAIEHGGQDVTVRVGPLQNTSGFFVEDDGAGISSDEDIFEPGFTTNTDGTGLGLSIVHDIVTAHGWDIAVKSSNGGARFEVKGIAE